MEVNEEFIINMPRKAYKKISTSLIIFAIFDAIYAFVDIFWAGFLGSDTLIIVGLCAPLFLVIFTIGNSIGQGANSLMSRFLGAENKDGASNTLFHGIVICFVVSIFIPLICLPFLEDIFRLMSVNASNMSYIFQYLTPLLIGSFIFLFSSLFSETIQSEGDSKRPAKYIILGNALNMVMDPIFIFVFKFGLVGLAYATLISSLIPLVLFLKIYLIEKSILIKIDFKKFKPSFKLLKEILKVTIPNFIDTTMFTFLGFYVNFMLIASAGTWAIGIYVFLSKLRDLVISPIRGGSRGLLIITGHLYGANKFKRIREIRRYAYKMQYQLLGLSFIFLIIGLIIANIYFNKELYSILYNHTYWDTTLLFGGFMLVCSLLPFSFVSSKMLDGFGKSVYSLICTIIKISLEIGFIYLFYNCLLTRRWAVLDGLIVAEIIISIIYYFVLEKIISNLEVKIDNNRYNWEV